MDKKLIITLLVILSIITISSVSASENQTDDLTLKNDELTIEAVSIDNEDNLKDNSIGTFTELQDKINDGGTISLYKDYKYDSSVDNKLERGIRFNSITINGNNHVIDGAGQARIFSVAETQNVILKDIIFKNAKTPKEEGASKDKGAAIYFYGVGGSKIINCTFIGNSATNGGAIYWDYSGNAAWNPTTNQIINSTFINNYASSGAAVYWQGFRDFEILNSNFNDNRAQEGSSVYVSSSFNVLISDSRFNDSRESIYVVSPSNGKFILSNNVMSENDFIYLFSGVLSSNTKIIVLDNDVVKNPEVLKARIVDDNNNTIKLADSYESLQFLFGGKSITATQDNKGIWTAKYSFADGIYKISAKQTDLDSAKILEGTIYINIDLPKKDITLSVDVDDIIVGQNATVKISIDKTASGTILISIDDIEKIIDLNEYSSDIVFNLTDLTEGNYTIDIHYSGDDIFNEVSSQVYFIVNSKTDSNLNDSENISVEDINSTEKFNNQTESVSDKEFDSDIKLINVKSKDLKIFYNSGEYYTVRVYENNKILNNRKVIFTLNGKKTTVLTDKNGYAKISISNLKPKTYTIIANYDGFKVKNKIIIKSVINAKKTSKVKKSFKIKITLKGKTILKNKKIIIKFKNKTYRLKTNNKGVAIFKSNKKIIKKLKKGKKYSYTIKYNQDTVKRYLIIK